MRPRIVVALTIFALIASNAAHACGPFFPYAYLAFGRERDVLKLPEASFYNELCRVMNVERTADDLYFEPFGQRANTLAADAQALADALGAAGTADDAAAVIVGEYRRAREPDPPAGRSIPYDQIPREFALYAEGASKYHVGENDAAIAKWKELLALPADQRKFKSVWAAYMIGRALRDTDVAQANAYFEQTRALANEGYADPLALSGESYGWQGFIANKAGDIATALENYATQFTYGGINADSALSSLHMICSRAFDTPESLAACATRETASAVLTAWVVSHPGYARSKAWVALLANANAAELPQADLLAWIAYHAADFESARKLLNAKSAATPYGNWVRSKLLLRDGKVDDAMALMQQIAVDRDAASVKPYQFEYYDEYPPHSSIDAELGVLLLGKQRYAESFERFIRAGFWRDAAYVGERVMSLDELKSYIEKHSQDPAMATPLATGYYYMDEWDPQTTDGVPKIPNYLELTRYLLARRLARENRWADAQSYWPAPIAERAAQLVTLRNEAKAGQPPATKQTTLEWFLGSKAKIVVDRDRAKKLYDAATFTRQYGMELLGTEVQPDWHMFGGLFDLPGHHGPRARWARSNPTEGIDEPVPAPEPEELPEELVRVLSASDDELKRLRESGPTPNQRFHYRYVAADLMWQAAQNLPDNDVETLRALYTGGSYLKNRDPKAANKFYRSLVWRNLNMPYAQEADRLRWFPENPPE
ncbi:MAG: hypothetical protein IT366_15290 [Candidatus Hydrogenedentes bacterium]|nr:hypothetical protein [Candidatus Hydrogenedentota bacterium]